MPNYKYAIKQLTDSKQITITQNSIMHSWQKLTNEDELVPHVNYNARKTTMPNFKYAIKQL